MSVVIDNIIFNIDFNRVKEDLMINNSEDEEALTQMIIEAENIANPRAIYREVYITEKGKDYVVIDGLKLKSRILSKMMAEVKQAFIYVITTGRELEEWAAGKLGILESYWAEEIQKVILNNVVNYVYGILDNFIDGETSSEMNPGSLADWPIEEQLKLFLLLANIEEKIGVRLTNSYIMLPAKSVSGIKFPTKSPFENCQLCQRKNCPTRRVPFDQKLLDGICKM